jgi:hypothetical protein
MNSFTEFKVHTSHNEELHDWNLRFAKYYKIIITNGAMGKTCNTHG